jgi:hypothetical protein
MTICTEEYHHLLVFAELISSTLKMEAICSSETKNKIKLNLKTGVISQKMILFITTAVKTSNPTNLYRILVGKPLRKHSHGSPTSYILGKLVIKVQGGWNCFKIVYGDVDNTHDTESISAVENSD